MNIQTKIGEFIIYDVNLIKEKKIWINNASSAESNQLQKDIHGLLSILTPFSSGTSEH